MKKEIKIIIIKKLLWVNISLEEKGGLYNTSHELPTGKWIVKGSRFLAS